MSIEATPIPYRKALDFAHLIGVTLDLTVDGGEEGFTNRRCKIVGLKDIDRGEDEQGVQFIIIERERGHIRSDSFLLEPTDKISYGHQFGHDPAKGGEDL